MYNPTVSVVINTHNRGPHLKRLLDALSRQTYDNFEVIVVNGPSTDNTEEVLERYGRAIRTDTCPVVNLCVSRNIGVRDAAGEIIAFIDDDAVPQDVRWIENAVRYFEDEKVGIVGGAVYRLGGFLEFRYGYFDIWGKNVTVAESPTLYNDPKGEVFSRGQGANLFIRLKAVIEVGGFDEYYAYFLDETDLCLRIIQKGYTCCYGESMAVVHEAAGGANRKSEFHLNWFIISKSQGYYIMKASDNSQKTLDERKSIAKESVGNWLEEAKRHYKEKKISKEECKSFTHDIQNGVEQGIKDALSTERKLNFSISPNKSLFKKYDKTISEGCLNLCFLCELDCINPVGGVQVYTRALAQGLNNMGHNVYIITRGDKTHLSLVDGMNLCYVNPEHLMIEEIAGLPNAQTRIDFSYACFTMLQELKRTFGVQLVESPIWDSLGVVCAYLEKEIPVLTRLQTPFKMMLQTFNKETNPDYDFLMELEEALLTRSDYIITISDHVKDTIEKLYDIQFTQPVFKNYLGIADDMLVQSSRAEADGKLIVFFVGRIERRKGIHCILDSIPNIMEKYPNTEFHFAGDDTVVDEVLGVTYKEYFENKYKGQSWIKRVHFMGIISDEEKEQELSNCDVFVSPSLYESFGIIFLEAMRYSKPVIGCRVGGMQEVIADGETGMLAEPDDSASFEVCLDRLLGDNKLRSTLGKAGRKRFEEMFTTEKMCNECEGIYKTIIENH